MLQTPGPSLSAEIAYRRERVMRAYPRKPRTLSPRPARRMARLRNVVLGRV